MNKLGEIDTKRRISSARAFHILTVRMKKARAWNVVGLHFLGTNTVTFVVLLDLVALERTRLVGITVGLTLTNQEIGRAHV